jgi:4-amino-4-deoxy-L-arabinose transferase-like glycosyltransferase
MKNETMDGRGTRHRSPTGIVVTLMVLSLLVHALYIILLVPHNIQFLASDDPARLGNRVLVADEGVYLSIALNLFRGNGYQLGLEPPFRRTAKRPPGYPLLLAGIFHAFGVNLLVAQMVNALIVAFLPLVVYLLGRASGDSKAGLVGAGLCILNPGFYLHGSGFLMSEALLIVLVSVGLLCLLQALQSESGLLTTASAGVAFSLATLVHPAVALLSIVLAPVFFLALKDRPMRSLLLSALFVIASAGPVSPWLLRNFLAGGSPVITTNGGATFLGAQLANEKRPGAWISPRDFYHLPEPSGVQEEIIQDRARWADGLQKLRSTPLIRILYVSGLKIARFWVPIQRLVQAGVIPSLNVVAALVYVPIYLAFAYGLVISDWRMRALPLCLFAYFTIIAVIFWGGTRFRVPLEPTMMVFAGKGLLGIYKVIGRSK